MSFKVDKILEPGDKVPVKIIMNGQTEELYGSVFDPNVSSDEVQYAPQKIYEITKRYGEHNDITIAPVSVFRNVFTLEMASEEFNRIQKNEKGIILWSIDTENGERTMIKSNIANEKQEL